MPISVVMIGTPVRSAKPMTASAAPWQPPPTIMMGRFASRIALAALRICPACPTKFGR